MDLTAEAINEIKDLGVTANEKRIVDYNGKIFTIDGSEVVEFIPKDQPKTLDVATLSSMISYIKFRNEKSSELYIHIASPRKVELLASLDAYGRRANLVTASVITGEPEFNEFMDVEDLNIMLQSKFVETEDREIVLKVIGNLTDSKVNSLNDDGVSQKVTIQNGLASVGNVKVPNPVKLTPYRTFAEVQQPAEQFVFRMKEGGRGALFQVTNGTWQLQAINDIAQYFADNLEEAISAGEVQILA